MYLYTYVCACGVGRVSSDNYMRPPPPIQSMNSP
jgi:hypothetical protein